MVGTQCPPWGGHMASAVRDAYEVQGGWPPGCLWCLWLLLQPRSWKLIMIFSSLQQLGIRYGPPPGWETSLAWGLKKYRFKFKATILGIKKTYSFFLRWCSVLALLCHFQILWSLNLPVLQSSPLVPWSPGPLVPWSFGPLLPWSSAPLVLRSLGPLVFWSLGPSVLWWLWCLKTFWR